MQTPIQLEHIGCLGAQLGHDAPTVSWLWHGYIARGNFTLLTSQWKSGKTTLLSILLSRLKTGGILAGLPVQPARAIILSEEPRGHWRLRRQRLDLDDVFLVCRPFKHRPTREQWLALIDAIARFAPARGYDLLVIDTITSFFPGQNESSPGPMMDTLLPLAALTEKNLAVCLLHHPPKGNPLPGQAARGSGALASFTDINLEMSFASRSQSADPTTDRRRRVLAFSRYEDTPRQRVLELNPDATDYLVHGDFDEDDFAQNWQRLLMVLEDAAEKLTRQQILHAWPPDFPAPSDQTLWRWLRRAVAANLLCEQGKGRRSDPFRYWLPSNLEKWRTNPLYQLNELYTRDADTLLKVPTRPLPTFDK